ncbi:MAG TPA: winged helix-turn-helix domain-containing protein [Bryobacteraceae bacterium]|jgi:DNA-binding winged helix-turn-helix (wHTH) protein/Tol biopolymer transport system component|nr:winged helix-turn-helix domain-containing protein [Bryobacteraceae bacterium]
MPRYTFGPFSLDPEARLLLRDGKPVAMAGKTFDTLVVLVQNRGRLVDKDELLSRVWAGTVVEEANLSQSVFTVRKILGDSPKEPRYIATVAGRGYQFIAPVTEQSAIPAALPDHGGHIGSRTTVTVSLAAVGLAIAGALWYSLRRAIEIPPELVEHRLTYNSSVRPVLSAAISPDGRYLAYSDSEGVHLRLIATGEERPLSPPAGAPSSTAFVDSWFPDGTELLAHSDDDAGHQTMWSFSVMGQAGRELRSEAAGWAVSPDGRQVVFSPRSAPSAGSELWVMDSRGENARKVIGFVPGDFIWSARWSPDGRRLVYVRLPRPGPQAMETCDLDGRNRVTVVTAEVRSLSWLPDGWIVYSQGEARDMDANLWRIRVDPNTGAARGKPQRLTRWSGADLLSMSASADGKRIALQKETFPSQVYIGELISPSVPKAPPRRLTHDEAADWATAWTADSESVLFTSNRGDKWGIFKQALNRSVAEPLTAGRPRSELVRLSADGAWALYAEVSGGARGHSPLPHRLMRVPVNGGLPQLVLDISPRSWEDHECASSGPDRCVVVEHSPDDTLMMVTAFDPLKGRGKQLRTMNTAAGEGYSYSLSPDGSTLAVARGHEPEIRIRLLSLAGGADREINVKGWPKLESMQWSPDGRGLYCGSASSQGGTLLYTDLKGSAKALWTSRELDGGPFIAGVPSPDGRHIALTGAIHQSTAWMVEGF